MGVRQSGQGLLHFFCGAGEEVVAADGAGADKAAGDVERDLDEAPGEAAGLVETVTGGIAVVPLPGGVFFPAQPVYGRHLLCGVRCSRGECPYRLLCGPEDK